MSRIAVDAMGADGAPRVEVEGVVSAVREKGATVVLVGDEARLAAELKSVGAERLGIEIVHAPEVITMHDAPSMAVKQKKQSSMRVCFDLVKSGRADAVVSAGNSGAMLACGLFVFGRLSGVERPAIVTTLPTPKGEVAVLDMGANTDPKPSTMSQWAVLGTVYARLLHGKQRPKVGVLSNGSEEHKGTNLTRDTHQLLARVRENLGGSANDKGIADFEYVGYVEGRDIFRGEVDVVVTDGFTGNVVLKTAEGTAEAILTMVKQEVTRGGVLVKLGATMMMSALRRLRRRTDYDEYGGAPLLGVNGLALICHGGSNAKAIKNAVAVADRFAQSHLAQELSDSMKRHQFIWQMASAVEGSVEAVQ